jgi:hypothetical protein
LFGKRNVRVSTPQLSTVLPSLPFNQRRLPFGKPHDLVAKKSNKNNHKHKKNKKPAPVAPVPL